MPRIKQPREYIFNSVMEARAGRAADFSALKEQKDRLFDEIAAQRDMPQSEKQVLVDRVMEHSLVDGLALARWLGFSAEQKLEGLGQNNFYLKHRELVRALAELLKREEPFIDKEHAEPAQRFIYQAAIYSGAQVEGAHMLKRAEIARGMSAVPQFQGIKAIKRGADRLYKAIDSYYLNLLSLREVRPREESGEEKAERSVRRGEVLGERLLERVSKAGMIPIRAVEDIACSYLKLDREQFETMANKSSAALADYLRVESFQNELVGRRYIHDMLQALGVPPDDPKVARELDEYAEDARMSDLVFDAQKMGAEKYLQQELRDRFAARGFDVSQLKILQDQDTKHFTIRYQGEEIRHRAENGEPQEGASVFDAEHFEKKEIILPKTKRAYQMWCDANAQPYFSLSAEDVITGRNSLLYPDGTMSQKYTLHFDTQMTPNGIALIGDIKVRDLVWDHDIVFPDKRFLRYRGGNYEMAMLHNELYYIFHHKSHDPRDFYIGKSPASGFKKLCSSDSIPKLVEMGDGFGYTFEENGTYFFADDKGQRTLLGRDYPLRVININNKIAFKFAKTKKDRRYIKFPDGRTSKDYDFGLFDEELLHNGFLYFSISRNNKSFLVNQDGVETEPYDSIRHLVGLGDKVYFVFRSDRGYAIADNKGSKMPHFYGTISDLFKIQNDLYAIAIEKNSSDQQLIRIDPSSFHAETVKNFGSFEHMFIHSTDEYAVIAGVRMKDETQTIDVYTYLFHTQKELTAQEQKKFDLLNTVAVQPDTSARQAYFKAYPKKGQGGKESKDRARDVAARSRSATYLVNDLLKSMPDLFTETVAAVKDDFTQPSYLEKIAVEIFPEIPRNKARAGKKWYELFGFGRKRARMSESAPQDYITPRDAIEVVDGDPRAKERGTAQEVLRMREPFDGLVVSGLYGGYNRDTRRWTSVDFPVAHPDNDPVSEMTFTLTAVKGLDEVQLPLASGARIIPERVRGITKRGKEIPLDCVTNMRGEARARINPKDAVERVAYSMTASEAPEALQPCSSDAYESSKRAFIRAYGDALSPRIGHLPEELLFFADTIRGRRPDEQVAAIEQFVRDICYYDFDNAETKGLKEGKSFEERLGIMSARLDDIAARKSELRASLAKKKYAGVCADFALLTTALLRECGLMAGVAQGFRADGRSQSITTAQAHSYSFVPWPSEIPGAYRVITVDGTPQGATAEEEQKLAGIRDLSLGEKAERAVKIEHKALIDAEHRLKEIQALLSVHDAQSIRQLTNGELESVLNTILRYGVKQSHVDILETALNAARYSPFNLDKLQLEEPLEKASFAQFVEGEIVRVRAEQASSVVQDARAGSRLMAMMSQFAERFARSGGSAGYERALGLMDAVFQLIEKDLTKEERSSAAAVLQYLSAKQMAGKNNI